MTIGNQSRRAVAVLRDDLARKIAAGEVIDRPYSVVRELLDNAIDSAADRIHLRISDGGLSCIEVSDNGWGMSLADLKLCCLPHATSKILTEDDLLNIHTLGFRGEALSSISAVSRLSLVSRSADAETAHRLQTEAGSQPNIQPAAWSAGTQVRVEDLFYNLPARKKFMKRAAAETLLCRQTFLEKALPFPSIHFQFENEHGKYLVLSPETGEDAHLSRILAAFPDQMNRKLLHTLRGSGSDFSFTLVLGEPGLQRRDRKQVQIFANKRRIQEYSLLHAIEYGYQGFLPGGVYPVAFLFLEAEPDSVDFNIHPAKREARFKNLSEMHHRIQRTVQDHLSRSARKTLADQQRAWGGFEPPAAPIANSASGPAQHTREFSWPEENHPKQYAEKQTNQAVFDLQIRYTPQAAPADDRPAENYRFLGQIFELFLAVEFGERLLLVDMHAAHEKILYDALRANPRSQPLLFPLEIELESAPAQVEDYLEQLKRSGIRASLEGNKLSVYEVPEGLSGKERILLDFIQESGNSGTFLEAELYANQACRSAVMDGDSLTTDAAIQLISRVLAMENPRCPHGRPIWFELTKEDLYRFVGRT